MVIGEPNASRVSCAVVNDRDDSLPSLVCALYGEGLRTEGVDRPVGGGHVHMRLHTVQCCTRLPVFVHS